MGWLGDLLARLRKPPRKPVDPPVDRVPPGGEWSLPLAASVNAERELFGLSSLVPHGPLCTLASDWAARCVATGILTHGDPFARISAVYPGRPCNENLARGQETPGRVVDDWLDSPGHRATMLGDWTLIGAGRAGRADGQTVWCCTFVK